MADKDTRMPKRSAKSRRDQWGPTLEEEKGDAMDALLEEGRNPSSFGSMKAWDAAVQRKIDEERERKGPQAYDTATQRMIESPKARAKKLGDQMDAAEKGKAEAKKKGDEDFEKARKTPDADKLWAEWDKMGDGSTERMLRKVGEKGDEQMIQIETPSGGFVSARGKDVTHNFLSRRDADATKADRLADMRTKGKVIRDRLDQERATELIAKLQDKGIDQAPTKADGSFDADRAQGMLAGATFQEWDEEKRMVGVGREQQKMDRQRLAGVNRSLREDDGRLSGQERRRREDERAALLGSTEYMNDRDLRDYGARSAQNRLAEVEKAKQLEEAQIKQSEALTTKIRSTGKAPTEAELRAAGYPESSDDEAWQEIIKEDPVASEIYNSLRTPKVSRTGKTMAGALNAFV